jgi:NNP family nitrate/nitrite transporter-like MFS transporter
MPSLLFLVGIFFLSFISRIILAPLLPTIEKDLKIGHEEVLPSGMEMFVRIID